MALVLFTLHMQRRTIGFFMSSRAPDSLAFRSRLRSWRGFALLVLLLVALGAFAIHMVVSAEIRRAELKFESEALALADHVKRKLHANEAVLSGFVAFLQAVDGNDLEATRRYARAALAPFEHIYMLEVARRVLPEEQAAFELSLRQSHRPDFRIRSFGELTRRAPPPADVDKIRWPVVFMYPQPPAAAAIHGLDAATVPHLEALLSATAATRNAATSPVFEMFEGGRAYILLQALARPADRTARHAPDYFGNQMVALMLIRVQTLLPENIAPGLAISLRVGEVDSVPDEILVPELQENTLRSGAFLLPSFSRTISSGSLTQPLQLRMSRQLRWQDLANSGFIQIMIGVCIVLIFASINIRHQIGAMLSAAEEHERAEHKAMHDPLTGLPNRHLLADRVRQAVHRWERHGTHFAVLVIDLDYFKEINDSYGHEAGDRVLGVTASRMAGQVRASDTIARFGGDEFIIILADILSAADAEGVAEKIRCAVAEPISIGHHRLSITCSLGISLCPDDGIDFKTLRHAADLAMYEAKAHGRNTIAVAQG